MLKKSVETFDMSDQFNIPLKMKLTEYCGQKVWLPEGIESVNLFESSNDVTVECAPAVLLLRTGLCCSESTLEWQLNPKQLRRASKKILEGVSGFMSEFGTIAQSGPVCSKILSDHVLFLHPPTWSDKTVSISEACGLCHTRSRGV